MQKKVLITGHLGFIGQALVKRLQSSHQDFVGLSRSQGFDIRSSSAFDTVVPSQISCVVHLAGLTNVPVSWREPSEFYHTNTLGTQVVLDFCRSHSLPLIFFSSYLYGLPQYLPIDEDHPITPSNPYAQSKWFAEQLCQFYAKHYDVPVTILRPFNIYGPGQSANFLISRVLEQAQKTNVIQVQDTAPKRDYVYLDDLIDVVMFFLSRKTHNGVYNVGSGVSYSVEDVVSLLSTCMGKELTIVSENIRRENEIMDTVADISRLQSVFSWEPKTLEAGLRLLIDKIVDSDCGIIK